MSYISVENRNGKTILDQNSANLVMSDLKTLDQEIKQYNNSLTIDEMLEVISECKQQCINNDYFELAVAFMLNAKNYCINMDFLEELLEDLEIEGLSISFKRNTFISDNCNWATLLFIKNK